MDKTNLPTPALLLQRLGQISDGLKYVDGVMGLIGLGSIGIDKNRLDKYSDLDFFVIVSPDAQEQVIESTTWLTSVGELDFIFKNSDHGCKALFHDGVYVEYAVFTLAQYRAWNIPGGHVLWAKECDELFGITDAGQLMKKSLKTENFYLNEALSNLYIGLLRLHRGEKLNATRFIQSLAIDNVLELIDTRYGGKTRQDFFVLDRRIESRISGSEDLLTSFVTGYTSNVHAAKAIIDWLDQNYPCNQNISARINALISAY
jgi:lincosamide nucleotidyltransferase